jgi:RNA recognition motif-containing protein
VHHFLLADRIDRDDAANKGNNLYVAGLSLRTTEAELERKFSKYGVVKDCRLVRDPRTQESRGFGFITMETIEQADDAIRGLNRTELDGRILTVEKVLFLSVFLSVVAQPSSLSNALTCLRFFFFPLPPFSSALKAEPEVAQSKSSKLQFTFNSTHSSSLSSLPHLQRSAKHRPAQAR